MFPLSSEMSQQVLSQLDRLGDQCLQIPFYLECPTYRGGQVSHSVPTKVRGKEWVGCIRDNDISGHAGEINTQVTYQHDMILQVGMELQLIIKDSSV